MRGGEEGNGDGLQNALNLEFHTSQNSDRPEWKEYPQTREGSKLSLPPSLPLGALSGGLL